MLSPVCVPSLVSEPCPELGRGATPSPGPAQSWAQWGRAQWQITLERTARRVLVIPG